MTIIIRTAGENRLTIEGASAEEIADIISGHYTPGEVTVLIEDEYEGGYTIFKPGIPGLVTVGETVEEAKAMLEDAEGIFF